MAIGITWTGPKSFRVTVREVLDWGVHLTATAATKLMSNASRLLPNRNWESDRVLGVMGRVAGCCCEQDGCDCRAPSPTASTSRLPRMVWVVTDSTALVGGEDVGPPGGSRTRIVSATSGCDEASSPSGVPASTRTTRLSTTPPRRQEDDRAAGL